MLTAKVAIRAPRDCMRRASARLQWRSQIQSRPALVFPFRCLRQFELRNTVAMQHTANFRSAAAQDSFEFVTKSSVSFAHTHSNSERKRQARRIHFRVYGSQL